MPIISINGAQLYYETYGDDLSGKVPVLLIHGSTGDGRSNWATIAPILARRHRVIVPDCRGHGRSDNPNHSYSFAEMADDLAKLVRALGYEKAHVIGHSNGGNVALVMLVDHPDVVQTAIPQAANAYVDQYLFDREPAIFDPERIGREDPEWKERMLKIHGPHHEPGYWRELLALTLKEIISAPDYTAEDLARVNRPALLIQGADDIVNAPSHHAEFIAHHIPFAELWAPPDTGHNVHDERSAEWIDRVESFIERRGDTLNDALYRLGQDSYDDERSWVFDLHAALAPEVNSIRLTGEALKSDQLQAAKQRLAEIGESAAGASVDSRGVQVLLTGQTPWALVNRSVIDVRRAPDSLAERVSQALLGETVRILGERGEWSRVHQERDGYIGWVKSAALHRCTEAEAAQYHPACKHRVIADLLPAWSDRVHAGELTQLVGKLPFGVKVAVQPADRSDSVDDEFVSICLPDGRRWWLAAAGILAGEYRPKPDAAGIERTLDWIKRFVGTPYLWGGRTPFGFDCSGLAGAFWEFLGVPLKRDADQQANQGTIVQGKPQPGDLLFFGEPLPELRGERFTHVSHVAISLGEDRVIHATSALFGVVTNSLNPASPEYRSWLHENLLSVRRMV